MRRILSVFAALLASSAALSAHIFEEFRLALFDRAGFASRVDGQRTEGSLPDNFSNSAGVSFFIDDSYGTDWPVRGAGALSLFCVHDFARLGGTTHNSLRWGIESCFCFLNLGISQCYDFNDNEVDCIGTLGFRAGAWLNSRIGLDVGAGIERGFISGDNFVRVNVGLLFVPFPAPRQSSPEPDEGFEPSSADDGELLRRCSALPASESDGRRPLAEEIASRRFGGEQLRFADGDLSSPYAAGEGRLWFIDRLTPVAHTEDGLLLSRGGKDSPDCPYIFVEKCPQLMEGKPPRLGFFRSAGVLKRTVGGTEMLVPAFRLELGM